MFYQKKNNVLEPLTGSTLYAETPIGTVIASFLAVAPSGYIKADGTVYTKAQYPELYERIPDVFKDTTNETFTIDLREVALKGIGLSSLTSTHYSNTGLTLGEFIEDRLQDHEHNITRGSGVYLNTVNTSVSTSGDIQIGRYTTAALAKASDISSGRHGDTTEVKSVGVNYFVKAKHVALPIDIMDAISEEYATKEYVKNRVPDYSVQLNTQSVTSFTCPKDCVANISSIWTRSTDDAQLSNTVIKVNGKIVTSMDYSVGTGTSRVWLLSCHLELKEGDVLTSERTDSGTPLSLSTSALRVFGYVGE